MLNEVYVIFRQFKKETVSEFKTRVFDRAKELAVEHNWVFVGARQIDIPEIVHLGYMEPATEVHNEYMEVEVQFLGSDEFDEAIRIEEVERHLEGGQD